MRFLLIFLISLPLFVCAQTAITITVYDLANEGDEFLISNANPLIVFDPEDTGEDHVWDFSFLESMNYDTIRWVDEEDTDPFYFFLWFSSDIAQQTGSDIVTDYFTIEDVYNFYEKNDDQFSLTGMAGIISGVPLPINFDEADLVYEFPLVFGNSFSGHASFNIEIPGVASWSETRDRTTVVDGWGEIITPYHTYDVLRIRSEAFITDTISYDGFEFPISYTSIEYKWLAENAGIPVLQINVQSIFGSETITQVMYRDTAIIDAINDHAINSFNSVLINTIATNSLLLQINSGDHENCSAQIIALDGRVVDSFPHLYPGNNFLPLSSSLNPGFYMLVVKTNGIMTSAHQFYKSK